MSWPMSLVWGTLQNKGLAGPSRRRHWSVQWASRRCGRSAGGRGRGGTRGGTAGWAPPAVTTTPCGSGLPGPEAAAPGSGALGEEHRPRSLLPMQLLEGRASWLPPHTHTHHRHTLHTDILMYTHMHACTKHTHHLRTHTYSHTPHTHTPLIHTPHTLTHNQRHMHTCAKHTHHTHTHSTYIHTHTTYTHTYTTHRHTHTPPRGAAPSRARREGGRRRGRGGMQGQLEGTDWSPRPARGEGRTGAGVTAGRSRVCGQLCDRVAILEVAIRSCARDTHRGPSPLW